MGDYKISVEEAVALSNNELNKDDVYSFIRADEVPGCIYVKIKTSNSTNQSLLDV